jgi:dephospho-CoA kinase
MSQTSQTLPNAKAPLRVGITGGIGSGKTTVCRIFEELGIPVYYADERAKLLMTENELVVSQIKKLFGDQAYLPDHSLNRQRVASIVFKDAAMLAKLNAIVHPAVQLDGENWHKQQYNVPYTLKESALLFEIGSEIFFDKTIAVQAPKSVRLQRTMLRDSQTAAQVEARMDKQMDDEKKAQLADYVIINDNEHLLTPQVLNIHRHLVDIHKNT